MEFVAVTVNVYAWPPANVPVTVSGLVVPLVDKEIEGLLVTVYEVIEDPPVAPAVNGTDTVVEFVTETVPIVGACGTNDPPPNPNARDPTILMSGLI